MFKIGCHLSVANGYLAAAKTAKEIGANTFQYFSRNPRGGAARAVDITDINKTVEFCRENGIVKLLAHAPYTLNPSASENKIREFAKICVEGDLKTLELFGGGLYNIHPGSHVGQGFERGAELAAEILNSVMYNGMKTIILLEAMSGKGSEIGVSFEELGAILDRLELSQNAGVLIDTCHIYSAGYDIVNDLDSVLERFDKEVGLNRLYAIHLNDSMTPFNSNKDRHELLGKGTIGLDAFARIVNHKALRDLPFYLETPNEIEGYREEIALLKTLRNEL